MKSAVLGVFVAASFLNGATPMTITEQEISGSMVVHRLTAVRGDGSSAVASLPSGPNNTGTEARNVTLVPERKYVVVVDAIRAVSTFYTGPIGAPVRGPHCEDVRENTRLTGEDDVLGFRTYRFESATPQVRKVETVWLAPELDCRPLRFVSSDFDANGNVLRTFERSAMSVKLGEPDAKWFSFPADYREVPPSQANRELHSLKTGKPFGQDEYHHKLVPGMKKMDEKYFESQRYRTTGR